jgi:hypothetical protein
MTMGPRFADSDDSFSELVKVVHAQLNTACRLPDWPFKMLDGFAVIYEYDRILGGDFGPVIAALASAYGDEVVTVVGLEPAPSYWRDAYNFYPGFQVPAPVQVMVTVKGCGTSLAATRLGPWVKLWTSWQSPVLPRRGQSGASATGRLDCC